MVWIWWKVLSSLTLTYDIFIHVLVLGYVSYNRKEVLSNYYSKPSATMLALKLHFFVVAFWFKYGLDSSTTQPKFDPIRVRTHELQIMNCKFHEVLWSQPLSHQGPLKWLSKLPSHCYSNGKGNLGNLGRNEELQPEVGHCLYTSQIK